MAIRVFGDLLYCPESGYVEDFPTVESLKHKIMLSTKPPKEYLGSNHEEGETSSPKYKDYSDDDTEAESESDDKVEY